MDIIKRVSLLLWVLAIILVVPPALRYFRLTPQEALRKVLFLENPAPAEEPLSAEEVARAFERESNVLTRPEIHLPPPSKLTGQADALESSEPAPYSTRDEADFKEMIAGLEQIASAAPQPALDALPDPIVRPADVAQKVRWAPPPQGFMTANTFNYVIYRQLNPVTASIKSVLDNIHGNLMLDLIPFTTVAKPGRILVMLFQNKESYTRYTKRPAWSGASSNLKSDTMYVVEDRSFYPLSVHELTHLYFDGYFLPAISPLWLSEGMAVYMQIHTTKIKPSWVDASLRKILNGRSIPIDKMTQAEDLSAFSSEEAQIWYTQAYSLVDYMLNKRTRDEFYKFCSELKNGAPAHQALYRAYGMPFTKMTVLENVWLHDLKKDFQAGKILPAPATQPSSYTAQTPRDEAPARPAPLRDSVRRTDAPQQKAPRTTVVKKLQKIEPAWGGR